MNKLKIGVIGTINKDSITLADGSQRQGWGGIQYNLLVLATRLKKRADIFPACNVGQDCFGPILKILRQMPAMKTDFIRRVAEKNNHCHLTYHDNENKSEILEGGVPPLTYDDIKGLFECDAVLLNFISGRDIDLRALRRFRRHFDGIIYTDIHSYTLGKRADGRRFLRIPRHWTAVVKCSDFIQMNRLELNLLSGSGTKKPAPIKTSVRHLIARLKADRVDPTNKKFLITDGSRGCYLFDCQCDRGYLEYFRAKAAKIPGDTTGCGDIFGAAFLADYILNKNLAHAITAGQKLARLKILAGLPIRRP